jgi:tRNA 2-selenouridine synthase SelU
LFIKRIGGQEKIDQMKHINEAADKLKSVYGNVSKKEEEIKKIETMENIEEWKKGFMDGFEEAYKRIYGK